MQCDGMWDVDCVCVRTLTCFGDIFVPRSELNLRKPEFWAYTRLQKKINCKMFW